MGASSQHSTCNPSDQQDTMFSQGNRDYIADAGLERLTGLYEVDLVTGLPVLSTILEMHMHVQACTVGAEYAGGLITVEL